MRDTWCKSSISVMFAWTSLCLLNHRINSSFQTTLKLLFDILPKHSFFIWLLHSGSFPFLCLNSPDWYPNASELRFVLLGFQLLGSLWLPSQWALLEKLRRWRNPRKESSHWKKFWCADSCLRAFTCSRTHPAGTEAGLPDQPMKDRRVSVTAFLAAYCKEV